MESIMTTQTNEPPRPETERLSDPLRLIQETLTRLRFGAINLTVHEGKLVQVDVTERKRFTN
jgi:hypothetical protein